MRHNYSIQLNSEVSYLLLRAAAPVLELLANTNYIGSAESHSQTENENWGKLTFDIL